MLECNECKKAFKGDENTKYCPYCGSMGVQPLPQKTLSEENQRLEAERASGAARTVPPRPSESQPTVPQRPGAQVMPPSGGRPQEPPKVGSSAAQEPLKQEAVPRPDEPTTTQRRPRDGGGASGT